MFSDPYELIASLKAEIAWLEETTSSERETKLREEVSNLKKMLNCYESPILPGGSAPHWPPSALIALNRAESELANAYDEIGALKAHLTTDKSKGC